MTRLAQLIRSNGDRGGVVSSLLIALLVLAGIAVAGFFYFGGEADVDIKKPDVNVTTEGG